MKLTPVKAAALLCAIISNNRAGNECEGCLVKQKYTQCHKVIQTAIEELNDYVKNQQGR